MFTPLFFRRLAFLAEWVAFGAVFRVDNPAAYLSLLLLSFGFSFLQNYLAGKYGAAAEPLIPAWLSFSLAWRRVRALVQAGLTRLEAVSKGHRVLLLALVALLAFFFVPPLIRLVYPSFGGFAPDTINAYTLGATQYFLALTLAYASWRGLFPSLYQYAAETMEGKLLESITADLVALLPDTFRQYDPDYWSSRLAYSAERRKIATLQFLTRCARFIFSVSPFVFFFVVANAALTAALTAVPA